MQALLRMILGFARTTLFVVLVAAVVLWLAGSQWGQPLRGWIGAASAAAPTTVVVVPTATASVPPTTTVIPTATATPLPTQTLTPTATPYVVQRDAIVRAMANKWTMTTQTAWVETSWQLDTSTNRGMFDRWWNGTQDIEAHAEYDVSAGMDFDRIGVLISAGNKISITLLLPASWPSTSARRGGRLPQRVTACPIPSTRRIRSTWRSLSKSGSKWQPMRSRKPAAPGSSIAPPPKRAMRSKNGSCRFTRACATKTSASSRSRVCVTDSGRSLPVQ